MGGINAKEFIEELLFCLKEEDIVKAKALLQFASDANVSREVQKQALSELAKGPERVVFPLLEYLTKIDISDPEIQEGLYDLIMDKAYGNTDLVIEYISNNEKPTRLQFIRAAGDLYLTDTLPALTQIICTESDPEILTAAIKAMGGFRNEESLPALSALGTHNDIDVRKAAIFAVSENAGATALAALTSFLGEDEETNKLAVEALADIQSQDALKTLTSLLSSPVTNIRDTAIDQLIKLGSKATPLLTQAFKNAEADYLIHLITTLGYIKDPSAVSAILDIVNTQPKDANIRQAAYEAMERIPSPKTAICLAQGLQDPVESVRMSAARAIDKNLSRALVAGLKNIVRQGNDAARMTVAALIDIEASNIFNFLVEEESFQELAISHITETASPATRKTFVKQMILIGKKEFAGTVAKEAKKVQGDGTDSKETAPAARIVVVDDSKMMLKLYQNKLSSLNYDAEIYNRPEEAIPKILMDKPALVITDLNMPNISGLELTREIRRTYTRQDLPILMITTQSDFVEKKTGDIDVNDAILKKSGINQVLHKPFTDEDFKAAVAAFVPA